MILSPDDHRTLQAIDGGLAADEPHLAAMFGIFSRLGEAEDPPPSEDLIAPWARRAPTPSRRPAARVRLAARRARSLAVAAVAVPVVLLVTLVLVVAFTMPPSVRCPAAAGAGSTSRATVVAPDPASLGSCPGG
jgi:hypothetical protein